MATELKVGMLARAENRGLGIQTLEFFRHVKPHRTLLIDMGELARGFEQFPERFPGAWIAPFENGMLPEPLVRRWLKGLDVVYTAETLYDWRLADWASDEGVATVVQLNPEFYRHAVDDIPEPTAWWAPSPWRMEHLAEGTRLVGVPVAADRFPMEIPERDGRLRVVHVAGNRAAGDRNGTLQLFQALRLIRQPMEIRVLTQDPKLPRIRPHRGADVILEPGGRDNYWDLYQDADVLVMPRRYGGLCLPVQEAMACGLAVMLTDCSPNEWWPNVPIRGRNRGVLNTGTGRVRMMAADQKHLAALLDELAADPERVRRQQELSLDWAERHTWNAMLPFYREELELAADRRDI